MGNNLEMLLSGTSDKLVFQDWYLGSQYHVEEFRFADGTMLDSAVQSLATAMAIFGGEEAMGVGSGSLTRQVDDGATISHLAASAWR